MAKGDGVRLIHRAISFDVTEERVTLPNAVETTWTVIRHPGAVCVLPLDGDDLIVIRNWRPVHDDWMIELPGGGISEGEAPLAAARRELREEAGFEAATWKSLGPYRSVQGFSDFTLHYFLARDFTEVGQNLDEFEVTSVERVPLAEIPDRLRAGAFTDSQIPTGLFLAMLHGALPARHHEAMLATLKGA
jgi:ADP-ribose pyrophosphatase